MADEGNDKQGKPNGLATPDPAGYFTGESMPRRTMFSLGVPAAGGVAVTAVPEVIHTAGRRRIIVRWIES